MKHTQNTNEIELVQKYSNDLKINEVKSYTIKKGKLDLQSFETALMLASHIGESFTYFETDFKQVLKENGLKMTVAYFAKEYHGYEKVQFYLYNRISKIDKRIIEAFKKECFLGKLSIGLESLESFSKNLDLSNKGENERISEDEVNEASEETNDTKERKESQTLFSYTDKRNELKISFTIHKENGLKTSNKLNDIKNSLLSMLKFIEDEEAKHKVKPEQIKGIHVAAKTGKVPTKKVTLKSKQANIQAGLLAELF